MKIYTIIEQNDKYIKLSSANEITIIPIVDVILVDDNSGYISIKNTASRKTIGLIKKSVEPVPPTPTPTTQIICKYNVTSTSDATNILGYQSALSTANVSAMEVDGVDVPVNYQHTFSTLGEHIVKYTLTDNTEVGEYMFEHCTNLTYVTLPDSITSIGNNSFNHCGNLTTINIPSGVTSIGEGAFAYSGVTSLVIPSGVTEVKSDTYYQMTSLANITFEATTPPTLRNNYTAFGGSSCPIYVPSTSVNDYKTAWSYYENRITSIQ